MTDQLKMQATVKAQENISKRIEKEVIGAWRAGYDYLYIAPDVTPESAESKLELAMNVSYKVLPTEHRLSQNPFDVSMEEYDLTDLTVEKVKSL